MVCPRRGVPVRSLSLLLALAACDSVGPGLQTGPCPPGALPEVELNRQAGLRQESTSFLLPWDGTERTIPLQVWYPTTDTEGTPGTFFGFDTDGASLVDAAYEPAGCSHPVMVFSHGSHGWGGDSASLARLFASLGWVVVAPDHVGNTVVDGEDPPPIFDLVRVVDVRAALDHLAALPASDPLSATVDTSKAVVWGHSYGGQTAWLAAGPTLDPDAASGHCDGRCTPAEEQAFRDTDTWDPRVAAVAPLAGAVRDDVVAEEGFAGVDVPVLMLTGSDDGDGSVDFDRAALTPDLAWVEIEGACHESFTDIERPCDGIPKEDSLVITGTYLAAMANRHVLGAADARTLGVLDGSVQVDGRATLTR